MKKSIWLAAGIAGMLLGNPAADARAEVSIHIGGREKPSFFLSTRPDFISLSDFGFSISVGSPYDIILYRDLYYINQNGIWYCSSNYRGPWAIVRENRLPTRIKSRRWEDIRRTRDIEYRRHNDRFDRNRDNRVQRFDDNNRNNRNDNREPRVNDKNRGNSKDQRFDDKNRDQRNNDNRNPNNPPPDNRPTNGGKRN
ncbi:MAG: hypothetical protein WCH30_02640 [Chlorobiaceae bacterium]